MYLNFQLPTLYYFETVSSLSAVTRFGSDTFCSVSSHGSRMLSIPVDVLPTEVFLLWQSSEKLDDREWQELYPVRENHFGYNTNIKHTAIKHSPTP